MAGNIQQKWSELNTGQKIVVASGIVATASMFMNWVDIGFFARIGISQGAFVYLLFWVYPISRIWHAKPVNLTYGLACSFGSVVCSLLYIKSKSIDSFFGSSNVASVGAWLFLACSFALGYGAYLCGDGKIPLRQNFTGIFKSAKLRALLDWYATGKTKTKIALSLLAGVILVFGYDELTSDIGIFTGPKGVAIYRCKDQLIRSNQGFEIISAHANHNDPELGVGSFPITVTIIVRMRGPYGPKKGVATFACSENGDVLRIITWPDYFQVSQPG